MALWTNNINKFTHPFFKITPKSPWRSVHPFIKIKAQRALKRPFVHHCSTFKIKPRRKKLSTVHPRSSLDDLGSTKHLQIYILRRSTQMIKFERVCNPKIMNTKYYFVHVFLSSSSQEFPCSQIWLAQWDNRYLSSLSPFKEIKAHL